VLRLLLILFVVVPLVELWLLTSLSQRIGLVETFAIVLLTGFIGAVVAKRQGLRTWWAIQQQMARGEAPGAMLIDGVMILVAGALLVTPGVLTDALGLALLIPLVRAGIRQRLHEALRQSIHVQTFGPQSPSGNAASPVDDVIDVEYERRPE